MCCELVEDVDDKRGRGEVDGVCEREEMNEFADNEECEDAEDASVECVF